MNLNKLKELTAEELAGILYGLSVAHGVVGNEDQRGTNALVDKILRAVYTEIEETMDFIADYEPSAEETLYMSLKGDMVALLEVARVGLACVPEDIAERMDISDEEVTRLREKMETAMGETK